MNIYPGSTRRATYRAIFKKHYGPIPKDPSGRSYDIHHIDGDHSNSDPTNLKAVTVQEHYNIHYAQQQYGACLLIGKRLSLTPEEISDLARKRAELMVINKTHNFLGGKIQSKSNHRRVSTGTHPWAGENAWSKRPSFRKARKESLTREKNPRFDPTIYSWKNKKTGEIFTGVRQDFCRTYHLLHSSVGGLLRGSLKSTDGWIMI